MASDGGPKQVRMDQDSREGTRAGGRGRVSGKEGARAGEGLPGQVRGNKGR